MGFYRQEYWSGLPFPSWPRDWTLPSCLQVDSLLLRHLENLPSFLKPCKSVSLSIKYNSKSYLGVQWGNAYKCTGWHLSLKSLNKYATNIRHYSHSWLSSRLSLHHCIVKYEQNDPIHSTSFWNAGLETLKVGKWLWRETCGKTV